jgi:hypothetical protein
MRTPAEARSVSISIDRVALPMEEPIEAPPAPVNPPWVGSNEDWRRNAGFCKEVTILEPHPPGAGRGVDPIL